MRGLVNGHPHWERVQEIADTFMMISDTITDEVVYMDNNKVPSCSTEELCGTTACHAGWFSYFSTLQPEPRLYPRSYDEGRDEIEAHLGFAFDGVSSWAAANPEIWGNKYGDDMFYHSIAFGKEYGDYSFITLKVIADHWQKVANRLYKLQKGVRYVQ
jgi:hypothetical protein